MKFLEILRTKAFRCYSREWLEHFCGLGVCPDSMPYTKPEGGITLSNESDEELWERVKPIFRKVALDHL